MRYTVSSIVLAATAYSSSTVELPERCKLPSAQGPCRAAMPRWYFNKDTKNCEQFIFGGCMPNENNFFTESECENACEAYIPHQEQESMTNQIKAKSAPISSSKSDGCEDEAFVTGRCRAMLNRWSWNPETLECEKFVFGGCDGNGNNFPSRKKCEKKCSYLASQRVMLNDAIENEEEEEEEDEEVVEEKPDPCSEPKKMGRCRARFDRYYYNSKTGDCEYFTYGGCEGNGNNFQTIQLCRQQCMKSKMQNDAVENEEEEEEEEEEEAPVNLKTAGPSKDACTLEADPGFCRGYFKSWYFDGEECKEFVYGGCQGNANRFPSKEACENVCQNDEPIFGRGFVAPETDNKDDKPVCEQPIFTGPCRAMYPKFAFDGENCVPFMYGGCMGNQNNFGSEELCRRECMMKNEAGVGSEEEEEEEEGEEEEVPNKNGSRDIIMSREAIRDAKKRERQAERKKSGKNGKNRKNNAGKKSAGKKNKNNNNIVINNRSNNRVKGLSKSEEDEMRFNFNQNMLTF